MNEQELQQYVEEISIKYFKKPFKHLAFFNSRLQTTGGRYHLQTHNLDFNPKIFAKFGEATIQGIVKHELCHYHLHLAGKGYRHGDLDFKYLLKKVDGLRYTPSMDVKRGYRKRWVYVCKGCKKEYERQRRFDVARYRCGTCQSSLVLLGRQKIYL